MERNPQDLLGIDHEATPAWDVLQVYRECLNHVSPAEGEPILRVINNLEATLFNLEMLYERPACKGED